MQLMTVTDRTACGTPNCSKTASHQQTTVRPYIYFVLKCLNSLANQMLVRNIAEPVNSAYSVALEATHIYRVIRKSVKHFKNSQQINYSTDHGSSYADRERNSPSCFFFYIFHRCSLYPPLVIRQTSMR